MRVRDVAGYASQILNLPSEFEMKWENPELRRDFYTTIIKLCQKKEDFFTSPPHDPIKTLQDAIQDVHRQAAPKAAIDEAKEIIYGDREQTYGRPDRNFHQTAQLWNAYLFERPDPVFTLRPSDVAIMMVLLKIARHANTYKRDNIVDGIGYFACVDRIKEELDGE